MDEEKGLSWSNFAQHTQNLLNNLYNSGKYTDVTLICDDQTQFRAHKLVLGACSTFFENIFSSESDLNCIYLRGIGKVEMQSILQLIYNGQSMVDQSSIDDLSRVSNDLSLKIKGLSSLQPDNNIGTISNADVTSSDNESTPTNIGNHMAAVNDIKGENDENKSDVNDTEIQYLLPFLEPHPIDLEFQLKSDDQEHEVTCDESKSKLKSSKIDNKTTKFYNCKECKYKTICSSNLKKHVRSIHEGERYKCKECDYQATHPSGLLKHKKVEHEGKRFNCTQCNQKFRDSNKLKIHISYVHQGIKYQCEKCVYHAQSPILLKYHVKSQHDEVGKYKCTKCDYQANVLTSLNKHVEINHEQY